MLAIAKSFEKHLSFTALGGLLGLFNDLATPLAGTNIYGLFGGATALAAGLAGGAIYGFRREAVTGLLGFGGLMLAVSMFFIVNGPAPSENPTGYLAAQFDGLRKVQDQMAASLGRIEQNTGKTAENTAQIAEHTQDIRGFAIDKTRFHQAIENNDRRTVVLACQSGHRAGKTILFENEKSTDIYHLNDMVDFLIDNDCVATRQICGELFEPGFPIGSILADNVDVKRVRLICGKDTALKVAKHKADIEKNGHPIANMLKQRDSF